MCDPVTKGFRSAEGIEGLMADLDVRLQLARAVSRSLEPGVFGGRRARVNPGAIPKVSYGGGADGRRSSHGPALQVLGGGAADAYVRTDAEPDINDQTIAYIEKYVPEHSGENFIAHVTVGLAKLDDLAEIEAESFDTFTFSPAGLSVYQLGNNGTAAKHLKSWTV